MRDRVPLTYLLDSKGQIREKLLGLHLPADFEGHLIRFLDTLALLAETPSGEAPVPAAEHAFSSLTWIPKGYRSLAICFSHVGYGPLNVYSQSPFQALRLGIRPRTPSTLGKGQYEVRGTSTWVNV